MAAADAPSAGRPAVSVVVPSYQRAGRLERLLRALAAQDLAAPFDVVIVDDGSTDGSAEVAERLGQELALDLRVLRLPVNGGPSAARNVGWRAASAPLVAFTDDDCAPSPGWLRAVLAAAEHAGVVQGRTEPDPEQVHRLGPFSRTLSVTEEGLYPTCNVAYDRALLERLDGFDPDYHRSCDDTDLAWRARAGGATTVFAPDALVYHEVTASSFSALLRTLPRWDDVPLTVKRHPSLRSRYLLAGLFWRRSHPSAIAAALGLLLFVSQPKRRFLALALLAPYVEHRLRRDPLPRAGPRRRVLLLPQALAVDLAEVAVMVKGSLRHRSLVL